MMPRNSKDPLSHLTIGICFFFFKGRVERIFFFASFKLPLFNDTKWYLL